MEDKAMLNNECCKMSLNIIGVGGGMPDKPKTFGQHLQRWIDEKYGMNAKQLAQAIGKSRAYVGYLLSDLNPSTGKPIQVKGPVADKIADALDRTRNEVRQAAGLSGYELPKNVDENIERLLQFYADLPPESKSDMVVIAEALWRKRRSASNHLEPVKKENVA
jgi:plasmid maintenance system antidote protein VapI